MTQKYYIALGGSIPPHLDGAYSIKVERLFTKNTYFAYHGSSGWERGDSYDILTDAGGLRVFLLQSHLEDAKFITAYVKSSLKNITMDDILEFVKLRIETEVFLSYDNYKEYSIEVYSQKAMKEMIS